MSDDARTAIVDYFAQGPWVGRDGADIYPGLMCNDAVVTGSINIAGSRLSLWALVHTAIHDGWDEVEFGWSPGEHYGYTADDFAAFLHDLLEMRGEFGRLLLTLAAAERAERRRGGHLSGAAWWETKKWRRRVSVELQRCLDVLTDDIASGSTREDR